MYSRVIIVGHLGADPTLKDTPSGGSVCSFSVADTRKYRVSEEQKVETTWFRVAVWGKQAPACAQYLQKGGLVLVEGRLIPDENGGPRIWKDKADQPRASFEIRADTVRFLSKKEEPEEEDEGF